MIRNRSLCVFAVGLLVHAGCGPLPGPGPRPTPTPPPTPKPACSTTLCPPGSFCIETSEGPLCQQREPPTTTTTTTTMLPPPQCQVEVGKGYFVDLVVTRIGGNPQLFTATAKYCGTPVRSDLFPNCGTKCCVLGVDGVSEAAIACEKVLSGVPVWFATPGLNIVTPLNGNPYNCKIASGQGRLKACGISGCSNEIVYP